MRRVALLSLLLVVACGKAPSPGPAVGPTPGPAVGSALGSALGSGSGVVAPATEQPILISLTIGGGSANRGQIIEARAGELIVTTYAGATTSAPAVTPLDAAAWAKLVDALAAHDIHWVDAPADECGGGVAHTLKLSYASGRSTTMWRHCGKGTLAGDLDGFVAAMQANLPAGGTL